MKFSVTYRVQNLCQTSEQRSVRTGRNQKQLLASDQWQPSWKQLRVLGSLSSGSVTRVAGLHRAHALLWVTFATVKLSDSLKLQYQRQVSRLKWLTKKESVFSRCIMWLYFCIKWDHHIGNFPPLTYANKLTEVAGTMTSINKQHNKVWGH